MGHITKTLLGDYEKKSLTIVYAATAATILLIVTLILQANQGMFIYTLDDPYIHLALSENLAAGHYGININEVSAPASSILWPYLLVLFRWLGHLAPLLINLAAMSVTIFVFWRFAHRFIFDTQHYKPALVTIALLVFFSNVIGLVFTGMEHTLQVCITSLMIYGLLMVIEEGKVPHWLLLLAIIAPLIRYENTTVSGLVLGYLFFSGQWKRSIIAGSALIMLLLAFSYYLYQIGLNPFPSSVMAKSDTISSGGSLFKMFKNFLINMILPHGWSLFAAMVYFIVAAYKRQQSSERLLALLTAIVVLLHLLFAKFSWLPRYESYLVVTILMVATYLNRHLLTSSWDRKSKIFLGIALFPFVATYLVSTVSIPLASSNIYNQQYQMHRFVTEFYQQPVAINDLGWVAYKNPHYILDIYGLASKEALQLRLSNPENSEWANDLLIKNKVELAIIYAPWFPNLPSSWQKVATLDLVVNQISVAYPSVSFYAQQEQYAEDILTRLKAFEKTLPPGASLSFIAPVTP